jgi:two-component system LytT family response regulator
MREPSVRHPEAALKRARLALQAGRTGAGACDETAQPIVVKDRGRTLAIPAEKLDFVEAQGDYVALHSGGRRYLKLQAISTLEDTLSPTRFVRVHRSRIVNLERIARIFPSARDCGLTLADGTRLGMSRAGCARLLHALDAAAATPAPDSPTAAAGDASASRA